jgi:hypothetical protein
MATQLRRLFVNWFTKTLQISDTNGGIFVLPAFNKYETVPFAITIVEPALNSRGIDRFSRVDISPLSLSLAIHSGFDTASPLAYQTAWTKDETENVFSGELALNTAGMNAAIGSSDTVVGYFEIEIQEATARSKIYRAQVDLKNAVTQVTSTAPTPADEYLTKNQTIAQFAAKVGRAGEQFTLTSPSGLYQRVIGVDDGGAPVDQILPV